MGSNEKRASGHFPRVRKYTKIVQMTPEVMEGVILTPEIFGSKQGATSTPEIYGNKHSFVLTFFATNTIYINNIVNVVNLN